MFYFGIETIAECCMRVDQRKLYGRHNVEQSIIEYNFHEGIKRVQQNLHLFDNITFIDGNSNYGEAVAIYIKDQPNMKLPITMSNGSISSLQELLKT